MNKADADRLLNADSLILDGESLDPGLLVQVEGEEIFRIGPIVELVRNGASVAGLCTTMHN